MEAFISGKNYQNNFAVDLEGGMRWWPSTFITQNELKVGKIKNFFGQLITSHMIQVS